MVRLSQLPTTRLLLLAAGISLAANVVPPKQAYGIVLQVSDSSPSTAEPVFSAQSPLSGKIGETFVVLLPLVNAGTVTAENVQVTSVSLGMAKLTSPKLPISRGPYAPSDPDTLALEFDAHNLTVGLRYLLTARGTYYANGHTLTFALSLYVKVTTPISSDQVELEHSVAIDAVSEKLQSLPGIDPATDNQELLTFIRSRPEFIDSGIDAGSSSVWATFADGEPYIIVNDRILPAKPTIAATAVASRGALPEAQNTRSPSQAPWLAAAAAQTMGLPVSSKALFINVFGSLGAKDADAIADMSKWLKAQNYAPVNGEASIASWMNGLVFDDGVFYITSHGGIDDGAKLFGLYTSDAFTPALDQFFRETDALGKTVVKMTVQEGRYDWFAGWVPATHYGITAAFVRKYFIFGPNSFVYIDGCGTMASYPEARDFRQAFFDAGASVYAGWTGSVDDTKSANTARLIFDRLLGANQFALETLPTPSGAVFKQRPFDWNSAAFDADQHEECPGSERANGTTCGYDEATGARLMIAPKPKSPSQFSLLAPSIGHMTMDEGNVTLNGEGHLTIDGIFGSDQGSVMVGGTIDTSSGVPVVKDGKEVEVVSWSKEGNQIVVKLPLSGLGSAGNVQVSVRDHVSNVAQLTEWRSQSDQVTFVLSGAGSQQQQQNYGLHLRADIRQWRKVIHKPPSEPGGPIASANDSTGALSSSGTGQGIGITYEWKRTRSLVNFFGSPGVKDDFFFLNGAVSDSKHMTFGLDAISTHGGTCTVCTIAGCSTSPLFSQGPFGWFSAWAQHPIWANAKFEANGDSVSIKNGDESGDGPEIFCSPTNKGSGTLTWKTIPSAPGTAPDPESAR